MSRPDQELLIPGTPAGRSIHPVLLCFSTKCLAYLPYAGLLLIGGSPLFTTVLTTFLILIDFWCTQNIHGFELIGLSWSFSFGRGFGYISKPDPFIPNQSDSDAFWMSFIIFVVLWTSTFFVSLLTSGIARATSAAIGAGFQGFNLLMFMKAHRGAKAARDQLAKHQADEADGVKFELVKEEAEVPERNPGSTFALEREEEEEEEEW
jgi:hypothetical protein